MCRTNPQDRAALTLIELIIAIAIMSMVTVAMATLTHAVRISNDFNDGVSNATQHARVVFERINGAVTAGYASESFPGAIVMADTIGSYRYPDTLVIWRPTGTPVNSTGLPLFSEIVVYCPNPASPAQLLEITSPNDNRTVPAITDLTSWAAELAALKTGTTSQKTLLTDMLRTAVPTSGNTARGVVQFFVELRPTAAEWASYRAGSVTFENVHWAQGIYGSQTGLRQTWVRGELQLMPGYNLPPDTNGMVAMPFIGSSSLFWSLNK